MKVSAAIACILFTLTFGAAICDDVKFAWRELEFAWPSNAVRQEALDNGKYVPSNNLPLAFDVWRDKIFLTVPRWKTGVGSTLNYIEISDQRSPILHPYPNFSMNQLPSSSSGNNDVDGNDEQQHPNIISAFGIRADECDRLWVVDSGLSDLLGKTEKFESPSIFIFDLTTSKLIRRFEIPEKQIKPETFFVNVYVDAQNTKCGETFAYVVDIYGNGIIVYDYQSDKSWRVNHHFFAFDPIYGDFNVGNVNFQWNDGIFGMALGDIRNEDGDRTLYFHALSSTNEFTVENYVLKNESSSTNKEAAYHSFNLLGSRGSNKQSSIEVYDAITNVIFYTQINLNAVGCWNTKKAFTIENQGVVAQDDETLIFPNDLRIDDDGYLWILSNRMPIYIYSNLKSDEYNYYLIKAKTTEIIKGTPCEN